MKKKIAFAGFRHGHIMSLYDRAGKHQNLEIVAACEEDAATRDALLIHTNGFNGLNVCFAVAEHVTGDSFNDIAEMVNGAE